MTRDPTPTLQEESPKHYKWDVDASIWQPSEIFPKPLDSNIFMENENNQKAFYELFPENRTPTKMSNVSLDSSTLSPSRMQSSPRLSNMSPNMTFLEPLVQNQPAILDPMFGPSSSKPCDKGKICTFCRKNGETPLVYTTHVVKQRVGNKQIVTCPILRSHVCSTCGVSGDQAHTM